MNKDNNINDSKDDDSDGSPRHHADINKMDITNMDERHYMRNYVKQQQIKMMQSLSEQVIKNEFNFFREFEDHHHG